MSTGPTPEVPGPQAAEENAPEATATVGEPSLPELNGPARSRRGRAIVLGVVASVVALGAVLIVLAVRGDESALARAHEACLPDGADGIRLADDDRTLLIDTQGDDDLVGAEYTDVACLLLELEVPDRVVAQIDSTRALDGRQSDAWDRFTAMWSYHPDSGLDLLVVED